jgi:hypothetical protein
VFELGHQVAPSPEPSQAPSQIDSDGINLTMFLSQLDFLQVCDPKLAWQAQSQYCKHLPLSVAVKLHSHHQQYQADPPSSVQQTDMGLRVYQECVSPTL